MKRAFQFAIFLAVVMGSIVGLHVYLWSHLIQRLQLPNEWNWVATLFLVLLGSILVGTMPIYRLVQRRWSSPFAWVGYTWMGTLVFLCLALLLADIAKWVVTLLASPTNITEGTISKGAALFAVLLGIAISCYAFFQALQLPKVKKIDISLPKLPSRLAGFRIVQLTDLHIGPTLGKKWLERVVLATNELTPDLIAITGDLVDGTVEQLREHVAPLAGLRAKYGVFFVTGNHEYYSGVDAWIAELQALGIRVLRNECIAIHTDTGDTFDLIGIDDHHSGSFEGHGPNLTAALAQKRPDTQVILLAHQPAAITEAAQHGVNLQLSGHTHGGQLWPWNYFVRLQQPYVVGLHRHRDTQIYISPGTGYWGPPMRFLSQAEITHITLLHQEKIGYSP